MNRPLTVELNEATYTTLKQRAEAAAKSPEELAAAALEHRFGVPDSTLPVDRYATAAEEHAARLRFERHFGAVDLGQATGVDNDGIDADLARAYAGNSKEP